MKSVQSVISAVVIQGGGLLLVRKEEIWILPGGNPRTDESDVQCLFRELCDEEISRLRIKRLKYLRSFHGVTPPILSRRSATSFIWLKPRGRNSS